MRDTRTAPRRMAAAAVVVAGAFGLAALAARTLGGEAPVGRATGALATAAVAVLLLWVACRATAVPISALGLDAPRGAARAAVGAVAGLGVVLAGSALVVLPAVLSGVADLAWPEVGRDWAVPLLLVGAVLPEEVVFRGYVQHALGARLRGTAVVLGQATLFAGAIALAESDASVFVQAFLLGILLGFVRQRSPGLWVVLGVRTGLVVSGVLAAGLQLPPVWALAAALVPSIAAVAMVFRPSRAAGDRAGGDLDPLPRRTLVQRGVLYDVGSSYLPGQHSRERWRPDVVDEELRVIDEELHCTAVTVFGEDIGRLEASARMALEHGLFVWVQPRLVDGSREEIVERLARTARFCERLRTRHPDRVGLNVGCELTIFASGIIPGRTFGSRLVVLTAAFLLTPLFDRRLNRLLERLVDAARPEFGGPLTYGSGTWESVDWSRFDMVGVDYYLDVSTRADYRGGLRALGRWGKPVLVTEFGCCSYRGARERGGSGADILDWRDLGDRRVKRGYERDEQVQADVIEELLDVYETEDVHGAFVCMFIEGDCRYAPDPERDQDKASFGIVRPPPLESGLSPDDGHWEPKAAFHAIARRYGPR